MERDRGESKETLSRLLYRRDVAVGRETLSMALCYSHVTAHTRCLIILSSVYHTAKIGLVWVDACQRWSSQLGIMSLLIDHWHLDSYVDLAITLKVPRAPITENELLW